MNQKKFGRKRWWLNRHTIEGFVWMDWGNPQARRPMDLPKFETGISRIQVYNVTTTVTRSIQSFFSASQARNIKGTNTELRNKDYIKKHIDWAAYWCPKPQGRCLILWRPQLPRAAYLAPPRVMDEPRPRWGSSWLTAKVESVCVCGGGGDLFHAILSRSSTPCFCWIKEFKQLHNRIVVSEVETKARFTLLG
jgi:hypothetical protein